MWNNCQPVLVNLSLNQPLLMMISWAISESLTPEIFFRLLVLKEIVRASKTLMPVMQAPENPESTSACLSMQDVKRDGSPRWRK